MMERVDVRRVFFEGVARTHLGRRDVVIRDCWSCAPMVRGFQSVREALRRFPCSWFE